MSMRCQHEHGLVEERFGAQPSRPMELPLRGTTPSGVGVARRRAGPEGPAAGWDMMVGMSGGMRLRSV